MRSVWNAPDEVMAEATFERIVAGLPGFSPPPLVFFGGIGEPLMHPQLPEMIDRARSLGSRVELITNGTLLTERFSHQLIEAGLDVLWASLDGATPESYTDVRLGASLPKVLAKKKTALATSFPPAATVCGRRGSFNARDMREIGD